jgi:hypothetical protein
MPNPTRFVIGGAIGIAGLAALALAAGAHEGLVYWAGLALFAVALAVDLLLMATAPVAAPAGGTRDEGPPPLHMQTGHGLGAAPPPSPQMPGQGIAFAPPRSPLWGAAAPLLRGAGFAVVALVALAVASGASGFTFHAAMAVFVVCTLIVFRHIAHGGRPPRLIPELVPATPGAAFGLGGLLGAIAIVALVSANMGDSGGGLSLTIAIVAVLAIFVLIRQWWDRADRQRHATHRQT